MTIDDRVYDPVECDEPVLIELLGSEALARLGGVNQSGAGGLVLPQATVTRREHSVGVMALARALGASVEEQVAALLHDIAHTAFSHVADYALAEESEDLHERLARAHVETTDAPAILARHGVSLDAVLDLSRWSLVDAPAPGLSADRIDYTLRDLTAWGFIDAGDARGFVAQLVVYDGSIACADGAAAAWFARSYEQLIRRVFGDPVLAYANQVLAEAIRLALERGHIDTATLLTDDARVLSVLRDSGDADIAALLDRLRPGLTPSEGWVAPSLKARWVDPPVIVDGRLVPVSVGSS